MSFSRNLSHKYGKKLLITATKTGLDVAKAASKKVVHKTAEAKGEFIGNKIGEKIPKPKPVSEANSRNAEEIKIPPEEREVILNELRKVL